jgi:hypothetical protein
MASFVQTATQLFSGGSKLTCYTDQISLEMMADPVEFSNYCSAGSREYRQGLRTWNANASGFLDFAAVGATTGGLVPGEEIIPANLGATTNLTVCPVGGTEGAVAYLADGAYASMLPVGGAVGDAARYSFSAVPATLADGHKLVRGRLEANRTVTSSSNTTGSNTLGALSASQGLSASLHVFTLSGTSPTLTVKVQSDDNSGFSSATDRITFSTASTRSGQFAYINGAVTDTYWRVSWTIGGSATPTVAFAVSLGIS